VNRAEIGRLIHVLQAEYPHHQVADVETLILAWTMGLGDLPYHVVAEAAVSWIRSGERFFPSSGQLRQLVIDWTGALPSGSDAWTMVMDRMRSTYPGHPAPSWDVPDPVRQAVKAMGGMDVIRHSEAPGIDRSQYLKIYETYRARAARDADVAALVEERRTAIDMGVPVLSAIGFGDDR